MTNTELYLELEEINPFGVIDIMQFFFQAFLSTHNFIINAKLTKSISLQLNLHFPFSTMKWLKKSWGIPYTGVP
jgi:hypothetical protein